MPSNSKELSEEIKATVLRPLAHLFGDLARQIDSGEYELPKTIQEAEEITEDYINQAYGRLEALILDREREAYDKGYEAGENAKPPSLIEAIKFRQEGYGWKDNKMASMLDLSKSHFSEFKNGKRGLPLKSIRKAYAIGIPASVLLQDQLEALQQPNESSKEES